MPIEWEAVTDQMQEVMVMEWVEVMDLDQDALATDPVPEGMVMELEGNMDHQVRLYQLFYRSKFLDLAYYEKYNQGLKQINYYSSC